MKYIIEIEDVPFSKVRFDADTGAQNINLYRAKGFKSLVFDQSGLDKLTRLNKALDEAFKKGYDEAKLIYQNPHAEADYQRGLNDAWKAASKIVVEPENGGYTYEQLEEGFGIRSSLKILCNMTPSEVISKIKAYEEKKKADSEIKVGDEVKAVSGNAIVVRKYMGNDGVERCEYWYYENARIDHDATTFLRKTGRHFPQMAELLKAMKGGAE